MLLACYLLTPMERKKRMRLSYIGFTVSPKRRIRQHNGELVQGAKKTFKHRPWEMVLVVHGFPTKELALQFEWLWQHPYNSRFTKPTMGHLKTDKSLGPMRSIQRKVRELHLVLNVRPWSGLSLTLSYTSHDFLEWSRTLDSFRLPDHMRTVWTPLDDFPSAHDGCPSPPTDSTECDVCAQPIASRCEPTLHCYLDCSMKAHVPCMSTRFLDQDNGVLGIPHVGTCPVCLGDLTWSRLLAQAVNPPPDNPHPTASSSTSRRKHETGQVERVVALASVESPRRMKRRGSRVNTAPVRTSAERGRSTSSSCEQPHKVARGWSRHVAASHDVVDLVSDDDERIPPGVVPLVHDAIDLTD
ncbi:hypothetical protein H310_14332 [Aphanomyces invadans]|uniref:Structure-specific endonuclease subunit SLX1 homolog n=1 Tax=Aphanomyces invadans TaxID=157072 RepID=A0A024TAI1_9STRA|nr:hypothetical protein H310_14332 [Aphanomyces invadans]ETV90999.1 hypothetical protein H310_14332 [Aphanomyces invadans]|eukprot:XP_008880388.1 hypothetical protein H310_14332 [Aphanomyces invadans]